MLWKDGLHRPRSCPGDARLSDLCAQVLICFYKNQFICRCAPPPAVANLLLEEYLHNLPQITGVDLANDALLQIFQSTKAGPFFLVGHIVHQTARRQRTGADGIARQVSHVHPELLQ